MHGQVYTFGPENLEGALNEDDEEDYDAASGSGSEESADLRTILMADNGPIEV